MDIDLDFSISCENELSDHEHIARDTSLDDEGQPGRSHVLDDIKCLKGIRFGHINIRSLFPKIDQLRLMLVSKALDILVVSETWLNDTYSDEELLIPGYHMERQDRILKRGGGLCIYLSDRFSYERIDTQSTTSLETLWLKFKLPKTKPILVGGLYRPPNISLPQSIQDLDQQLDAICPDDCETVLLGDINYNYHGSKDNSIKRLEHYRNFSQLIRDPTRVTEHSSSTIDLIFTNRPQMALKSGVVHCGLSDHSLVYFSRKGFRPKGKIKIIKARTYRNFNLDKFQDEIGCADWTSVLEEDDPSLAWSKLRDILLAICESHAPHVNIKVRDNEPPWVTDEFRSLCNDRDYFRSKAENSGTPADWAKANKIRNKVTNLVTKLKKDFVEDSITQNSNNRKELWRSLKKIIPSKSTSGRTKLTDHETEITDAGKMANIFNDFFASIGENLASRMPDSV